jgi:hypothetical protein
MESFYPPHAYICSDCLLIQPDPCVTAADIFSEYAYLSSYSDSRVEHARRYVEQTIPNA